MTIIEEKQRDQQQANFRRTLYHTKRAQYTDKYIKSLVRSAQESNDESSILELIDIYSLLINTFHNFLVDGVYHSRNKNIKAIVAAFIPDAYAAVRKSLRRYNPGKKALHILHETASILHTAFSSVPAEDINQQLLLLFINRVMRWKDHPKVPFSGYVNSIYKWDVKDWMRQEMHVIYKGGFILEYRESLTEIAASEVGNYKYRSLGNEVDGQPSYIRKPINLQGLEMGLQGLEIDERWVIGQTCTPPFDLLTQAERYLIKLIWFDRYTQIEISRMLGCHFNTVSRKKIALVKKLKARMIELQMKV